MRVFVPLLLCLVSLTVSARPETWASIQATGGLAVEQPQKWSRGWVLPVRANLSGTEASTVTPTVANPAMFCQSTKALVSGHNIYLVIESATYRVDLKAQCPPAVLGYPPAGKYRVLYRAPGDPAVELGEVTVGP